MQIQTHETEENKTLIKQTTACFSVSLVSC